MKKLFFFIPLLCSFAYVNAQSIPAYFPQLGLKAAYLFSGNAKDSSINANNGVVTGATLTADRNGIANTAYSFDGLSNSISIASSSTLNFTDTNFSISAWIKCPDYSVSTPKYVFWRGDGASAHDPYSIYITSGQLKFRRDVGSGTTINEVSTPVSTLDTSNWHFVVATYKNTGSVMSLYLDGALVKQQSLPGLIGYSTASFTNMIGNVVGGSGNGFKGKIDEVGVWDRVLSYCEIKKLYYSRNSLIISDPLNDTVIKGATATFTIDDIDTATSFQWQIDAGSGFTNLTLTFPYVGINTKTLSINPTSLAMNGYMYRCIRMSSTCNDTSTAAKLVVKTDAVYNIAGNYGIDVYPNPAHNNITIKVPHNIKYTTITLLNMMSQNVKEQTINNNSVDLDISDIPMGIYILKIEYGNATLFQKILKQ